MVAIGTDPIQDIIAGVLLVISYLTYKGNRKINSNSDKLDEVHTLVNQQLTDAVERRDIAEKRSTVLEEESRNK